MRAQSKGCNEMLKMMITMVALTQSETNEMVAKGSLGCGDCL